MSSPRPVGTYCYLSEVLGAPVRLEGAGTAVGRLRDIGFQGTAAYPSATCLRVATRAARGGGAPSTVHWSAVAHFAPSGVVLRNAGEAAPPVDFWVRRDVLDNQVVDISGAKVRRVNDVHLLYAEGKLLAVHAEIGVLGILRRLGIERPALALFRWLFDYTLKERFVTWRHVQVVSPGDSPGGVRVSLATHRLAELHPAELADILEELGVRERQTLLGRLDTETAAEAIEEMVPDVQRTVLTEQDPGKAADILEEMPPDEAADVLRDIAEGDAERIIGRMERDAAEDVRELLAHDERTAGGMMSLSCVEARAEQTAADVLEAIRPISDDVTEFNIIYVLDEARRLLGVVGLRDLLRAAPDTRVGKLMLTHIVKVGPDVGLEELGRLFAKYGIRAIPVVDSDNVFLGAVCLKDVLYELLPQLKE